MRRSFLLLVGFIIAQCCAFSALASDSKIRKASFPDHPTLTLEIENDNGLLGQEVCLSVTAKNFVDLVGLQFSIRFDDTVLEFTEVENFHPALKIDSTQLENNFRLPGGEFGLGSLSFLWFGSSGTSATIADGQPLFDICFRVVDEVETYIYFSNDPTAIEAYDKDLQAVPFESVRAIVNYDEDLGPTFTMSADTAMRRDTLDRIPFTATQQLQIATDRHTRPIRLVILPYEFTYPPGWGTNGKCQLTIGNEVVFTCDEVLGHYNLTDDTVSLSFTITTPQEWAGNGTISSRFLVYDPADSLRSHKIVTFINEVIGTDELPVFSVSTDSSYQLVKFDPTNPRNTTIVHPFDIINNSDASLRLTLEVIEVDIPQDWESYCFFEMPVSVLLCDDQATSVEIPPSNISVVYHLTISEHYRKSGIATIRLLLYDPQDSLATRTVVTLVSEFQYPELDGPSFTVQEDVQEKNLHIDNADDFPVSFEFNLVITNNLPYADSEIRWKAILDSVPEPWTTTCTFGPNLDCGVEESSFFLDRGGTSGYDFDFTVTDAGKTAGEGVYRLLLYDPLDSLRSHHFVEFRFEVSFPTSDGPDLLITPGAINPDGHQQLQGEELKVEETITIENQTIFPIEFGWVIEDVSFPENWDVSFQFEPVPSPFKMVPQNDTVVIEPLSTVYFEFDLQVNDLKDTPGRFELKVLFYDLEDSLDSRQYFTVDLNICPPKKRLSLIEPLMKTAYCPGEIVQLSASDGFASYQWTTGDTTTQIATEVMSEISVLTTDTLTCEYEDSLSLFVQTPFPDSICLVTVDQNSGKNALIWNKTPGKNTIEYQIYKETETADNFVRIGTQSVNETNIFVDEASNPQEANNRYRINAIDSCGNESSFSPVHKTMHLTINQGVNGEINLIWDAYQGFQYSTFNILRGSDLDDLRLIAQRPGNTFSFTDLTPPSGPLYYQIEIMAPEGCNILRNTDFTATRSNIVNNSPPTSTEEEKLAAQWRIIPNPASAYFSIEGLDQFSGRVEAVHLTDQTGKIVLTWLDLTNNDNDRQFPVSTLSSGIYWVHVLTHELVLRKKLVIVK